MRPKARRECTLAHRRKPGETLAPAPIWIGRPHVLNMAATPPVARDIVAYDPASWRRKFGCPSCGRCRERGGCPASTIFEPLCRGGTSTSNVSSLRTSSRSRRRWVSLLRVFPKSAGAATLARGSGPRLGTAPGPHVRPVPGRELRHEQPELRLAAVCPRRSQRRPPERSYSLDNGAPVTRFKTFARNCCNVEVSATLERHGYNTEKTAPIDWYSFRTPSARTPADAARTVSHY